MRKRIIIQCTQQQTSKHMHTTMMIAFVWRALNSQAANNIDIDIVSYIYAM